MKNPATSVIGVGRDFGRLFRERPALIVGGGVLVLIGVNVLNRKPGDEAPVAADPAAGLFPGVGTYGGEVPGSGSVPFAGYPSAGDGAIVAPPSSGGWFDVPLPSWGLTCNGEPRPSIAGLPGTWECADAGWQYVPPSTSSLPSLPAPSPTPTPTPTPTSPSPTPTPTPTPTTTTAPRPPGGAKPSSAVAGYIGVTGVKMYRMWGTWSTYPGPVSGLRDTGMTGSRWVSTVRYVYFGSDPAKRTFAVRRVAGVDGVWGTWFVDASVRVYPG